MAILKTMIYTVNKIDDEVLTIGLDDSMLDFLFFRVEVFGYETVEAEIPSEIIHAYHYKDGTVKYFTRWGKLKLLSNEKKNDVDSSISDYVKYYLEYYCNINIVLEKQKQS